MNLLYKSSRNKGNKISSAQAIINGIAPDGGLYVPDYIPVIDKSFEELMNMEYKDLAFYIMKKFLTDFDDSELKSCVDKAYDNKFSEVAKIVKNSENTYFLELFNGPTLAFKDVALSILPHLMKCAYNKINLKDEIVILTATSGDTGKAALEGFKNVDGTKIIVFYPCDGVSDVQKRQMITQQGKNTYVVGIKGNFDDAQRAVKEIFTDKSFNEKIKLNNYIFSSANSINIGRLIPQVVYYVYSYVYLLKTNEIKSNEKINFSVPTGNFGNILACYYAKQMGVPINKLICASNENNVLTDFINEGIYDGNKTFKATNSPSMDIVISSNLERLLFHISGGNDYLVKSLMNELKEHLRYRLDLSLNNKLKDFYAGFTSEEATISAIKKVYESSKYVIDTHTAVAYDVYNQYKNETDDKTKTIIVSTASPFKFPRSVNDALCFSDDACDDFELIKKLSRNFNLEIPQGIKGIENREIMHISICEKNEVKNIVEKILKV